MLFVNNNINYESVPFNDNLDNEISSTIINNTSNEAYYIDTNLNFFGVSSGIKYTNLDITKFENR